MHLTPILDREEYVEQAYFFRAFRERLREGVPAQEVLSTVHEEILTIVRLPMAIQFLATELKHSGLLAPAFERLPHYFTPFQAFVIGKAEEEKVRFSIDAALQVLEGEARYRAENPSPAGLFVYQFEAMSRNRMGYNDGLSCMGGDAFYDDNWREYMETVRKSIGDVDFADLLYLRSELYIKDRRRDEPGAVIPPPLFGEKEGKIAKASRGRDPLFLFAALQRQLGYPEVPRPKAKDDPEAKLLALQAKFRDLEMRFKVLESEVRGKSELIQFMAKPELLQQPDDD